MGIDLPKKKKWKKKYPKHSKKNEKSTYQADSLTSGEYKGAFFLAHAIIMVSVGLPLSYLLSVIGQFSGSGVLQGV